MKHIEQELIDIVKDFYEGDDATFNRDLASLDSYYGTLGEDRWERMEELNEYYRDCEPIDILERAFFGHDADTDGQFNPNRDYFKFNSYGNLVSSDFEDYSDWFNDETIEKIIDAYLADDIDLWDSDLAEIIDDYMAEHDNDDD